MTPTPKTHRVTVDLDPLTWSRVQTMAREQGTLPREWLADQARIQSAPIRGLVRDLVVVGATVGVWLLVWTLVLIHWH